MSNLIAYCGLNCAECRAYVATQRDDAKALEALAAEWSSAEMQLGLADMYCDGCNTTTGRVFGWCTECPIRLCSRTRGLPNCAHCADLPCDKLARAPAGTIERLQEMRAGLNA